MTLSLCINGKHTRRSVEWIPSINLPLPSIPWLCHFSGRLRGEGGREESFPVPNLLCPQPIMFKHMSTITQQLCLPPIRMIGHLTQKELPQIPMTVPLNLFLRTLSTEWIKFILSYISEMGQICLLIEFISESFCSPG